MCAVQVAPIGINYAKAAVLIMPRVRPPLITFSASALTAQTAPVRWTPNKKLDSCERVTAETAPAKWTPNQAALVRAGWQRRQHL